VSLVISERAAGWRHEDDHLAASFGCLDIHHVMSVPGRHGRRHAEAAPPDVKEQLKLVRDLLFRAAASLIHARKQSAVTRLKYERVVDIPLEKMAG
jgi:hypothetical protein